MSSQEIREWTVMFYLATDNPLAPGVITHLKNMKNAGYHPQVNVIAQFDPRGGNLPVHIFDVNRMEKLENPNRVNIGFEPNDSYVRNMVLDKLWDAKGKERITKAMKKTLRYSAPLPLKTMSNDQDPEKSLARFLYFCRTRYPARHYMLFILGHGQVVAGDVFLYDENGAKRKNGVTGPKSLLLKDLGRVLSDFKTKISRAGDLELIGFHSCSMSSAEVAYELKDTANFMLAAQGPTYVGSWPYRQILIRLYNDLGSSPFAEDDLRNNGLIDGLKRGETGETFDFIHCNGVKKLLEKHVIDEPPDAKLVTAVAKRFGEALANPKLYTEFSVQKSSPLKKLVTEHARHGINGEYLKWLNRQLLLGGLTAEEKTTYSELNIKRMLISIFDYCLFNSYDFQLAGYSCDLTLCNLSKIDKLADEVKKLVAVLTKAIKTATKANKSAIRDLLVLAHWEAQSYYEEKYTDLYDFCFCLKARCQKAESAKLAKCIEDLILACDKVMQELKRGSEGDDNGLIVRCEHAGPAYQYAHGLSVYFPWSEPIDNDTWTNQYRNFKFNHATGWRGFLKSYFDDTIRDLQEDEKDDLDPCPLPDDLSGELLNLLEQMSTGQFYNGDGQLKVGSKDPLGGGKAGSLDPTGSDCDCGSIKNYPKVSHSRRRRKGSEEHVKPFRDSRKIAKYYKSYQRYKPRQKP